MEKLLQENIAEKYRENKTINKGFWERDKVKD